MTTSSSLTKAIIALYLIAIVSLAVYSYTQVDLNLTLSGNPWYQSLQQKLTTLGYFERPASTAVFVSIIGVLFIVQLSLMKLEKSGGLALATIWKLVLVTAAILLFAYPAFSHDIFNYIFDARMVITHRVNPWTHTALDFPDDLWTRFMRWTHRTYPYGPTWLLLILPFYSLGFGKFTLTLLLFKSIGVASYIASSWTITKILAHIAPQKAARALLLFAFNPLVISETLVSAHIDSVMTAFLLLAILAKLKQSQGIFWLSYLTSVGTKFVTGAAFPIMIWWRGDRERFKKAIMSCFLLVFLATVFVVTRREPLPWYVIPLLALAALLPERKILAAFMLSLSVGMLLRYAPYLLVGDYSSWVKTTRDMLTAIPFVMALPYVLWVKTRNSSHRSSSL